MKHLLLTVVAMCTFACSLETGPMPGQDAGADLSVAGAPAVEASANALGVEGLLGYHLPIKCRPVLAWRGTQFKSVEDYSWDGSYTSAAVGAGDPVMKDFIDYASVGNPRPVNTDNYAKVLLRQTAQGCVLQHWRVCQRCQQNGTPQPLPWVCGGYSGWQWYAPSDYTETAYRCSSPYSNVGFRVDVEVQATTQLK